MNHPEPKAGDLVIVSKGFHLTRKQTKDIPHITNAWNVYDHEYNSPANLVHGTLLLIVKSVYKTFDWLISLVDCNGQQYTVSKTHLMRTTRGHYEAK